LIEFLSFINSVHPETPAKIPKLKLWILNNGLLGVQSFSFGSVSGWTLNNHQKDYSVSRIFLSLDSFGGYALALSTLQVFGA